MTQKREPLRSLIRSIWNLFTDPLGPNTSYWVDLKELVYYWYYPDEWDKKYDPFGGIWSE
jgi:hypothetical protein